MLSEGAAGRRCSSRNVTRCPYRAVSIPTPMVFTPRSPVMEVQKVSISAGPLRVAWPGDACDERSEPQDVPTPEGQAGGSNLLKEVLAPAERSALPTPDRPSIPAATSVIQARHELCYL